MMAHIWMIHQGMLPNSDLSVLNDVVHNDGDDFFDPFADEPDPYHDPYSLDDPDSFCVPASIDAELDLLDDHDEPQVTGNKRLACIAAKVKGIKAAHPHFPWKTTNFADTNFTVDHLDRGDTRLARFKCGNVSIKCAGKVQKIVFNRFWWEPFAYVMASFPWTRRMNSSDKLPIKRATSMSFIELAIATDLLTGGAMGPRGASLWTKASICKFAMNELVGKLRS